MTDLATEKNNQRMSYFDEWKSTQAKDVVEYELLLQPFDGKSLFSIMQLIPTGNQKRGVVGAIR
jgi:hypothetical protein